MKVNYICASISFLLVALFAGNLDGMESSLWVAFSEDGHSIVIEVDGIEEFVGVSSAVYSLEEEVYRVGNKGYQLLGSIRERLCLTPYGDAILTEATFCQKGSPYQFTLTLKRLKSLRAFTLQGVFHNKSDQDVHLTSFDLLDTRKNSGGRFEVADANEWLVTPLMESTRAVPLTEANKRLKEAAMLYSRDGNGFLVGPVGPAEAYTNVQFIDEAVIASVSMDGVLVRAGESRRSEEMIFCFEPPGTSTDIWTRWVDMPYLI